jgi:4-hydroxyphenylpyruvate dioxygenase-like putative hemolysin
MFVYSLRFEIKNSIFRFLGSRRKSQIQTFLEQNEGPGLQHLALKTDDIFKTIECMRRAEEEYGGFELMKRPSDEYYRELSDRLGDKLSVSCSLHIWRVWQFR